MTPVRQSLPRTPEQNGAQTPKVGPVPLTPQQLKQVSGGLPKGGWRATAQSASLPKGGW